jgi:hypothetical protein
MLTVGVERYDIEFPLVPSLFSTPDFDVPSDEIPLILVPFSDELLKMIGGHDLYQDRSGWHYGHGIGTLTHSPTPERA